MRIYLRDRSLTVAVRRSVLLQVCSLLRLLAPALGAGRALGKGGAFVVHHPFVPQPISKVRQSSGCRVEVYCAGGWELLGRAGNRLRRELVRENNR
jgi:hypothetical protein